MKSIAICCLLLLAVSCYKVDEKVSSGAVRTPSSYLWKSRFPKTIYFANKYDNPFCSSTQDITEYCPGTHPSTKVTHLMAYYWNTLYSNNNFFTINSDQLPEGFEATFSTIGRVNSDTFNGLYTLNKDEWTTTGFGNSVLGVTILIGRTNEDGQYVIQESDILINGLEAPQYNLGTIIVHEMGHFLGLQHIESANRAETVMFPSITRSEVKQVPTAIDKKHLNMLYQFSGATGQSSRQREIADGKGEEIRVIFELGADSTCRHLVNGKLIETHKVQLEHFN